MDFEKYKTTIKNLFSLNWLQGLQNKDFSKIDAKTFNTAMKLIGICFVLIALYSFFQIYVPLNPVSHTTITYTVQKGWGNSDIAKELKSLGIIRSSYFFQLYTIASFNHTELKAGVYVLSPNLSVYKIVKKMAGGDTIKDRFVVYEGWSVGDMGEYLESRGLCTRTDFIKASEEDYSAEFKFLEDKPKDVNLEGYLFPDTYEISGAQTCQDIVRTMLANFEKKLTSEIQTEITTQKKSIFEIITMASLLEKEVKTLEDKKIVSGILWKRLDVGMPLQLDSTVNYVTGGSSPSVSINETQIDSPYNTYKYKGLPKGPISNPGLDSIIAALEPTKSSYWFYLSDGKTYYAKTLEEHAANKAKYLD